MYYYILSMLSMDYTLTVINDYESRLLSLRIKPSVEFLKRYAHFLTQFMNGHNGPVQEFWIVDFKKLR